MKGKKSFMNRKEVGVAKSQTQFVETKGIEQRKGGNPSKGYLEPTSAQLDP